MPLTKFHARRPPRPFDLRQTRHGEPRTALCGRSLAKIAEAPGQLAITALGLLALPSPETCAACRREAERLQRLGDPALARQAKALADVLAGPKGGD